jgi:hypothetical protein
LQSRKELISDHGDPITLLNAFNEWLQVFLRINLHPHELIIIILKDKRFQSK